VTEPAIRIQGLRKTFRTGLRRRRAEALQGLDLEVAPGEILGFLGPNGAGKTTTIKILVGLLKADTGQASVFGEPVTRVGARRRLAYQPELPDFYDFLTAAELLGHLGRIAGIPSNALQTRIPDVLERVGLADTGRKRIGKFSRGMRQRVGIAQTMLTDPDLYILDEPMGGLDPLGRSWMKDLILELGRAGKTVFFSSHVLAEAEAVCDRVAFLHRGRLVAQGTMSEVLSNREESWEIRVEGALNDPTGEIAALTDSVETAGDETRLLAPASQGPEPLLEVLLAHNHSIRGVSQRHASLEDVFIETLKAESPGEKT